MKILSVNAGSSTLKFTLFEMPEEKEIFSGNFEKIGINDSFYSFKINGEKVKKEATLKDHKVAFELLVKELIDQKIVDDLSEIGAIGHRIVHGGAHFNASVIATPENIKIVEDLAPLAPLHNPPAISGLKSAMEVFPNAGQVLVFDTAFHQTMDQTEYLYPVPYEWYTKYNVRKYGFHGTSHKYIASRANAILGTEEAKLITCHIGSGASISAIKNGKCIDTSLGMTPNAGLMMGTRCGDIDINIMPYMMKMTGQSVSELENTLTKESGLFGISGGISDLRDIEAEIDNGNAMCKLAHDMYAKRIAEYIAKYYIELEGCDMIAFTAGVGERDPYTRTAVIERLKVLGFKLDEKLNEIRGEEAQISSPDSSVLIYTIPTNEELMIATDTYNLVK